MMAPVGPVAYAMFLGSPMAPKSLGAASRPPDKQAVRSGIPWDHTAFVLALNY